MPPASRHLQMKQSAPSTRPAPAASGRPALPRGATRSRSSTGTASSGRPPGAEARQSRAPSAGPQQGVVGRQRRGRRWSRTCRASGRTRALRHAHRALERKEQAVIEVGPSSCRPPGARACPVEPPVRSTQQQHRVIAVPNDGALGEPSRRRIGPGSRAGGCSHAAPAGTSCSNWDRRFVDGRPSAYPSTIASRSTGTTARSPTRWPDGNSASDGLRAPSSASTVAAASPATSGPRGGGATPPWRSTRRRSTAGWATGRPSASSVGPRGRAGHRRPDRRRARTATPSPAGLPLLPRDPVAGTCLEAAAERAHAIGSASYRSVESILQICGPLQCQ